MAGGQWVCRSMTPFPTTPLHQSPHVDCIREPIATAAALILVFPLENQWHTGMLLVLIVSKWNFGKYYVSQFTILFIYYNSTNLVKVISYFHWHMAKLEMFNALARSCSLIFNELKEWNGLQFIILERFTCSDFSLLLLLCGNKSQICFLSDYDRYCITYNSGMMKVYFLIYIF